MILIQVVNYFIWEIIYFNHLVMIILIKILSFNLVFDRLNLNSFEQKNLTKKKKTKKKPKKLDFPGIEPGGMAC